jgi:hypothetical protein
MPITNNPNDFNSTIEWTESINEIPNQSGFINSRNLFQPNFTDQESILFDRIESSTTLLADTDRRVGDAGYGKDRDVTTFSLPLGYMKKKDNITKQDFLSKRRAGTASENDTLANVISEKLTDLRHSVDQTHEYMKLQAIKGISTTPSGTVLANMFTEFGETQIDVDFDLGTAGTNVAAKCAEVKDSIVKNIKTGQVIGGVIEIVTDRSFFDKLVSHPNVSAAYLNSISNVRYQQDLSNYLTTGISDVFEYQGLRFVVYSHVFNLPGGATEVAIAADTGHAIPNVNGLFKAYYGPSQRLGSTGGMEMFAYEYRDPRDMYHELTVETAPLMFGSKPLALVKVSTST